MSKRPAPKDESLQIPSFLLSTSRRAKAAPAEEDVDAIMKDVHQAVRSSRPAERKSEPETEPSPTAVAHAEADEASLETNDILGEVLSADEPEAEAEPETEPEAEAQGEAESETKADAEEAPEEAEAPAADGKDEPESAPEPEPEPEPEPTLDEDLELLDYVERRLYAHRFASAELEAFGETIEPADATADRAEAIAVLLEEDHELLSRDDIGAMLERLSAKGSELEGFRPAQVRVLSRDRHNLVSVSAHDQMRLVRLQAESYDAWKKAKADDDWRTFAPYLDRLVALQRKIAKARNPEADPYDTLLDEFEPGTNRAFYNSFFARIKRTIIPLLSAISMSGRTLSRACVEGHFDEARQWELARDVARLEGINEDAHYLTSTEHPFSQSMTSNFAITAAHVEPNDLMSNVYTMLHEVGHNLYEQGVDPAYNRTSLSGGVSMGIHEAQSRFFENCVGRDRAFMGPLLDLMKRRFPGQLGRVTPNQLYQAVNRVAPSLVRVEADELTYPLHIVVRYEIEQLLLAGEATAREVPKLWADRYRDYLGVDVPNDTMGALQDVHWSQGSFGYFPSYALGNAYAAQLRAKMIEEGIEWDELLSAGDLAPIRSWLREHVWQHGRSMDPKDLIVAATGEPLNPRHYANYLTNKFIGLYNIR